MSDQTVTHDHDYPCCADAYVIAPVQETQLTYQSGAVEADSSGLRGIEPQNLTNSTGSTAKGGNLANLLSTLRQFLSILFPRHAEVTLIGFEGDDRQRIVIHQSNGCNIQPHTWNPGNIVDKGDIVNRY